MQGDDAGAQEACKQALYTALEAGLRLLHPFMPFVTEELWQRLPRRASDTAASIMVATYPEAAWAGAPDAGAEAAMERLQGLVTCARDLRTQRGLKPREAADITVACSVRRRRVVARCCVYGDVVWRCRGCRGRWKQQYTRMQDDAAYETLRHRAPDIMTLVGACESAAVTPPGAAAPPNCAVAVVDAATTLHLHLSAPLDPAAELAKLRKALEGVQGRSAALQGRMDMPLYGDTPAEVKERDEAKAREFAAEAANLEGAIREMEGLSAS